MECSGSEQSGSGSRGGNGSAAEECSTARSPKLQKRASLKSLGVVRGTQHAKDIRIQRKHLGLSNIMLENRMICAKPFLLFLVGITRSR